MNVFKRKLPRWVGRGTAPQTSTRHVKSQPLDEGSQALLAQFNEGGGIEEIPPLAEYREVADAIFKQLEGPEEEVFEVKDLSAETGNTPVGVRVYWPSAKKKQPVLLLVHGGGWSLTGVESYDRQARALCQRAGVIVISIEYRLAPEHPYPAALDDLVAVLNWVKREAGALRIDPKKIGLIGDSAGGNLCASLPFYSPETAREVSAMFLLYPVADGRDDPGYVSRKTLGNGDYFLSNLMIDWANRSYIPKTVSANDPSISPVLGKDLRDFPQTFVLTCGYDLLHDEGRELARNLKAAGHLIGYAHFGTTVHGFLSFNGALEIGEEGLSYVAEVISRNL